MGQVGCRWWQDAASAIIATEVSRLVKRLQVRAQAGYEGILRVVRGGLRTPVGGGKIGGRGQAADINLTRGRMQCQADSVFCARSTQVSDLMQGFKIRSETRDKGIRYSWIILINRSILRGGLDFILRLAEHGGMSGAMFS